MTKQMKDILSTSFFFCAISKGTITAEQIDKDTLIDTHYGAIAANAMEQSLGILLCSKRHWTNFRRPSVSRGRTRWSRGLQPRRQHGRAGSLLVQAGS